MLCKSSLSDVLRFLDTPGCDLFIIFPNTRGGISGLTEAFAGMKLMSNFNVGAGGFTALDRSLMVSSLVGVDRNWLRMD